MKKEYMACASEMIYDWYGGNEGGTANKVFTNKRAAIRYCRWFERSIGLDLYVSGSKRVAKYASCTVYLGDEAVYESYRTQRGKKLYKKARDYIR